MNDSKGTIPAKTPADWERLKDNILLNIFKVSHLMGRRTNRELLKLGFSLQVEQLQVLFSTYMHSVPPPSQQDIANLLQKDKAGIQRSVKTLERDGYLRITSDQNDRRRNLITLTPAGKLVVEKVMERTIELDQQMTDQLEPGEVQLLIRVLNKFTDILES